MIRVYYDGKCSLCSKEIRYYKRIATYGAFDWVDITTRKEILAAKNISFTDGLKMLHVEDETGQMHKGVDAFIAIWRKLPYWRMLAIFTSLPGVKQLAQIIYHYFAKWRFARLEHCQIALKEENA